MADTQTKQLAKDPKMQPIIEACRGDMDLVLFYLSWLKHGLNATKAYKELHPDVNDHSARVRGSITLAKINKQELMAAYGLDVETYLAQLSAGIQAKKWNDFTGEREADHKTRRSYHEVLGRILGLEQADGPSVAVQVNLGDELSKARKERGLG